MKKSLLILGLLLLSFIAFRVVQNRQRAARDARCAAEGQIAVEAFLRAGGAANSPAAVLDSYHPEIAKTLPQIVGDFVRMEGTGYHYPVWNIQGYHFLDLRRQAYFQHAMIPMRIIVTEGRVTAPNLRAVGKPIARDQMVFVSHPEVRP